METRIYGTIGPACHDTDTLARLFAEGHAAVFAEKENVVGDSWE